MCGVIGVIGNENAGYETYRGLLTLQHRGQDAAGIVSYDSINEEFHLEKDLGLVSQVFNESKVSQLSGAMALGHTRYSTVGSKNRQNTQPMTKGFPFGIAMAHNGNLVNVSELQQELKDSFNYHSLTKNDLEILLNLICSGMASENLLMDTFNFNSSHFVSDENIKKSNLLQLFKKSVKNVFEKADGGYAVVGIIAQLGLFAFRDPHGIRPLLLGSRSNSSALQPEINNITAPSKSHCFSSETVAFDFLGYEKVRDLNPGEFVFIDMAGNVYSEVLLSKEKAHCMFEWIYFSSPESEFESLSIYQSRLQLGKSLAEQISEKTLIEKYQIDMVVPVPDTSRTAAIAMAEILKIPYREVLIKNRYVQRSFILSNQKNRNHAVDIKLNAVKKEIEGKNILLVDDSLVRGTTSLKIIQHLKSSGAKNVILALTSPPIKFPCYYGIDFPDAIELMSAKSDSSEVAQIIKADHVEFLSIENLKRSLQDQNSLCTGCLEGVYPTKLSGAANFASQREIDRGGL